MSIEQKFEKAARTKLRFDTPSGKLSAEDLWDLPLTSSSATKTNLNDIAVGLYRQLKESDEISFVVPKSSADNGLQLKFDIAKYIIETRMAENVAIMEARAKREKKQQLMAILAQKELEELGGKNIEDLRKAISEME